MAILFAKVGYTISLWDISKPSLDSSQSHINSSKHISSSQKNEIKYFDDLVDFMFSLGQGSHPRLFIFSLPHGSAADDALQKMHNLLGRGDVIIDSGNEWYLATERRMKYMSLMGISYIGMGVGSTVSTADKDCEGMSMMLGGDPDAVKRVLPTLEKVAAKDDRGVPCVRFMGPRGAGHYVKMAHDGVQQGMMGVLNEAWEMMFKSLHMPLEEVSQVFDSWVKTGKLRNNYLLYTGSQICLPKQKDSNFHILNEVQDKVTQDATGSDGTGTWSVSEASNRQISFPTIASAHFYRVASADRAQRLIFAEAMDGLTQAKKQRLTPTEKQEVLKDLHDAIYVGFVAAYVQGLNLIAKASKDEGWNIHLSDVIQVWKKGAVIRSDHITSLLERTFAAHPKHENVINLLLEEPIFNEIADTFLPLKRTVQRALQWDGHFPAMSATLEYFKYCGGKHLPTQFMEAQLDYLGNANYDLKCEGAGEVRKGAHHYEWKAQA
ncbi:6-phosphogluconate dehydrogenase, decarboxylating [Ascobolus immersus RN42]|uniref:phosphogluconate dehydrogenase (NADP(+)-dependent, decarboxylating) n=1 Tax=Ascobolus immersus RN42 TaxID=1160509 RepID=A0A3N4IYI4_ASCIM|nr:6-phosphogluconate dehydrogenase, decarboxylating [Ascobolus immersus RN42]